jgi:hypothetical protein
MQRQRLLVLYAATSSPESDVGAWSMFDGSGQQAQMAGDSDKPPYPSVLAAMRDGWRVIQLPQLQASSRGAEHDTAFLKYEFVLEKMVEVS